MGSGKMTIETLRVLKVFATAPAAQQYGLELAEAAGLAPGSIYPILGRLEKGGWLTSAKEDIDPVAEGRRPRRYYQLTPSGYTGAVEAIREATRFLAVPGEQV